jgi:phage-related tail fiber protein
MDYPKSVPNVGLVDGQFADENPTTGQVGSLIPSAWGNAVTQELLNVIKAAGFVPDEGQTNQLLKAIQGLVSQGIKNSVRVATTGAIALSGVQTIDAIVLVAGDRVLVKNQASGAQNGIYVVAAGAWVRALDADESVEVKPGMLVGVDAGTANGGSVWRLSNATPPTLGATALTFEQVFGKTGVVAGSYKSVTVDAAGRVTAGDNPTTLAGYGITDTYTKGYLDAMHGLKANLGSPIFTGTPIAPTAAPGTNTQQLANTAFVQAALAALVNSSPAALDTLNELAAAIGNDPNFATTMLNALALKAPLASPDFTGIPRGPTAGPGTDTLQLATTAFVQAALAALKTNLAGFLSAQLSPSAGAQIVVTHNLGYVPTESSMELVWECVIAQGGWVPGEFVRQESWVHSTASTALTRGFYIYGETTTQVTVGCADGALWQLPTKTTGTGFNLTFANWRLRLRIKP